MTPRGGSALLPKPARGAAADAAFLRLLGLLFERPRPEWITEVRSLADEQHDERLRALASHALAATEGEYQGVFGHGGSVSPREVAHRRLADPGRMFADLKAFYEAFGFHPRAEDPVDHIAVQVGFAGYLALKEAYTITTGDLEGAERTREARALFLETHLRPFAAGLSARLAAVDAGHLEQAAVLLAEWAGCDESHVEPPIGSEVFGPGAADGPLTCGGCGGDEPDPETMAGLPEEPPIT